MTSTLMQEPVLSLAPEKSSCPVCDAKWSGAITEEFEYSSVHYRVALCHDCESLYYIDRIELDYATHTENEAAIRDYVEQNASVDYLAASIMRAVDKRPPGRLLDIGCGFGFACDAAKRLLGWDVVGVEPSPYGRRGAKALGLDIIHEFVGPGHPIENERFDAVFSSEVIEHVPQPREFAAFARSVLKPGGILILGTPDAGVLNSPDISIAQRLAMLSPGAHLFLYSAKAFEALFRNLGFKHVIIERQGTSLIGYASDAPFELSDVNTIELGERYCKAVLASDPTDEVLKRGMLYRLFRFLLESGKSAEAAEMVDQIPSVPVKVGAIINSYGDFIDTYPIYAGPLNYYHAMLELNYLGDFARARDLFISSREICLAKMRIAMGISVVEVDLYWACALHIAITSRALGDTNTAQNELLNILEPDDPSIPAPSLLWENRSRDVIKESGYDILNDVVFESPSGRNGAEILYDLCVHMQSVRNARVLELGAKRSVPEISTVHYSWLASDATFVLSDFEAGLDVDVVADIHNLTEAFKEGEFDFILNCSVLEHVQRPWIAMREMFKVLKPGGRMFIQTHQAFPIHGFPKDYWRFTTEGLQTLALDAGFEIIDTGYDFKCQVHSPDAPTSDGLAYLNVVIDVRRPRTRGARDS